MDLAGLLKELPAIVECADRDRLMMLWPEFEKAQPEYAAEIRYCLSIDDHQAVLNYLFARIPMLRVVRLGVRNFDNTLLFIHQTLREKLHGTASKNLRSIGASSTANALCESGQTADIVNSHPSGRTRRTRGGRSMDGQR